MMRLDTLRRLFLAVLGVGCVGLAYVGAIVPGMPATVFLIMACYLFARSCPYLEQRLVRNRFFAPFQVYLDEPLRMPMRARLIALAAMWLSVIVSVGVLWVGSGTSSVLPIAIVFLACIGSVVIVTVGRVPPKT